MKASGPPSHAHDPPDAVAVADEVDEERFGHVIANSHNRARGVPGRDDMRCDRAQPGGDADEIRAEVVEDPAVALAGFQGHEPGRAVDFPPTAAVAEGVP